MMICQVKRVCDNGKLSVGIRIKLWSRLCVKICIKPPPPLARVTPVSWSSLVTVSCRQSLLTSRAPTPRSCVEFRRSLPFIISSELDECARYATYHLDRVRFFIYSIPSVIGFNCGPLKLARPEIAYLLCNLYGLTGGAWGLNHVSFSLRIWPKGSAIHRTPNFFRRQNDTFWKESVPVIIFTYSTKSYFAWHLWFIMLLLDLGIIW